ncbi:MAG: hypothetical protein ACRBFS_02970 [Aureispira sp.]
MQHLDTQFLQQLVDQLSEDSLHSIYLNAFPKRHWTRLDATALDEFDAGLSQHFLTKLLSQASFELPLSKEDKSPAVTALLQRLLSIALENQDYQQEHGRAAFGFGYPLVLLRDPQHPSRLLQAPLLIWNLELEQTATHWVIQRRLGGPVLTNNTLAAFLQQRGKPIQLPQYDHLLNDGILDKEELAQLTQRFLQQLQPNLAAQNLAFFRSLLEEPLQATKSLEALASLPLEQATFLWSGVFGLYRHHKTALLQDTLLLKENWPQLQPLLTQERNPEDPQRSSFMKHSFPCLPTDPCQQQILNTMSQGKDILLQSPPGTGRSKTLAGILFNVLSNAGTCLVVSDKSSALTDLQAAFQATNLGELALLVDHPHQAPTAVAQSIWTRARLQQAPYQVAPSFIRLLQSCAAYVGHLQGFFKKIHQPILGEETWTDVVGQLLALREEQPDVLLDKKLQPQQFKYTQHEFESITRILPEGELLFQTLGRFQHPLNALNNRFFETANAVQMQAIAEEAIAKVLKVVQSAQRDAFTYLFEYEQLIERHLEKVYTRKMNLVEEIIGGIQGGLSKSSYHFNKSDGFYRKFMKRVSDKHKGIEEEKVHLLETFFKLQRYHQRYGYFSYSFLDTSQSASLAFKDLLKHVEGYKMRLYDWYDKRTIAIQQIVKDLAPRNIYPHVSFDNQVRDISSNLDAFERNFASSQVFRVDFRFVTRNIRKRLTQIEQLETNLKQLQESFEEFKPYHAFKFFWLALNPQQQTVLEALTETATTTWAATFSHWYLNALLAQHEDEYVPNAPRYQDNKQAFLKEQQALQGRLEQHTLDYWRGKQTQAVQTFHREKAPLTLGGLYTPQNSSHSLAHLVKTDPALFLSFYPVLLVSPAVAATILPLHPHLFDVVLVEQANQLPVREIFSILTRGRYQVLVGDGKQLPTPEQLQPAPQELEEQGWQLQEQDYTPLSSVQQQMAQLSSAPSLWNYAQLLHQYEELCLTVHYRTLQQPLIDFSNVAFYKNALQPIGGTTLASIPPIVLHNIEGQAEKGKNEQEWKALLTYLWAQPWEDQTVGIVVGSLAQRNAILKAFQAADATQQILLKKLKTQGLFVKQWEQLQGEVCDCLLVSTTETAPLWAPPYAARLVNVLATCARQQLVLFTSIPSTAYTNYSTLFANKKMQDVAWFYAYLAYAQTVSDQKEPQRLAILQQIEEHAASFNALPFKEQSPQQHFLDIVLAEAQSSYPSLTIVSHYNYAGLSVPLAVLDANQQPQLVFYLDLRANETIEEGYAWSFFYEERWQQMGIPCHYIWSIDWWKNKEGAIALFKQQLQACL